MYSQRVRQTVGFAPGSWRVGDVVCSSIKQFHVSTMCSADDFNSPPSAASTSKGISRRSAAVNASQEIQNLAAKHIDLRAFGQSAPGTKSLVRRVALDNTRGPHQYRTIQPVARVEKNSHTVEGRSGAQFSFNKKAPRASVKFSKDTSRSRGGYANVFRGSRDRKDTNVSYNPRQYTDAGNDEDEVEEDEGSEEDEDSEGYEKNEKSEEGDDEFDDDKFESEFENDEELLKYADFQAVLKELSRMEEQVKELLVKGTDECMMEATEIGKKIHIGVANCLEELAKVKQTWTEPQHYPLDLEREHPIGSIGDVPIGSGGMGRLIEDSLRLMARRQKMEWQDPHNLAEILASGNVVKLTDAVERNDIVRIARWKISDTDEPASDEDTFVSLEPASQEAIVQRAVRGEYIDKTDRALKGDVLSNIARITNGNFTYLTAEKSTLLKKIQTLLPR